MTSSLFIGKLKSFPQQNGLLRALEEYGRLVKTNFILRYLNSEDYRRRINTQLNKGEKLHDLRRYEHINPYGRYEFDVAKTFSQQELRPLRRRRDW